MQPVLFFLFRIATIVGYLAMDYVDYKRGLN